MSAAIGRGKHPIPSRTRKLSPFTVLPVLSYGRERGLLLTLHIYPLILCQLFSECSFLKLHVYILFRNKYSFGVNMECRKIGTDCGKSFLAEQRIPARRIFATALLVGGALFASCKNEPATPHYVTVPVVAPAQVGGEPEGVSAGGRGVSNPYQIINNISGQNMNANKARQRAGKQGRGVSNPLGSETEQDAGAEQEASPDASQGVVRNPFGEEESQDAGPEAGTSDASAQDGRGGSSPWGRQITNPWASGQDAGAEGNEAGSNPPADSADAGSSSLPEGRVVPNAWGDPNQPQDAGAESEAGTETSQGGRGGSPPWGSGTQQDSGGIVRNPMEK